MILRDKDAVNIVDWGNGDSHRLLVEADGMGFAMTHTVVKAGSKSALEYKRHLEACYCISGSGEVVVSGDDNTYRIEPGVLYALDKHDAHHLIADPEQDMHLVCVFNPPLKGDERHSLDQGFSHY